MIILCPTLLAYACLDFPPTNVPRSRNIKNLNSFHGFDKEKVGMQTLATYYNISFF